MANYSDRAIKKFELGNVDAKGNTAIFYCGIRPYSLRIGWAAGSVMPSHVGQ
jgi:hypothetical protein